MALIDIAAAHYESLGTRSFRVPEWDNTEIFVKPMTLGEQSALWIVQQDPKRSQFDLFVETVVLKSLDEGGTRLFSPADAKKLMVKADHALVERIANEIVKCSEVEDLKNS